MSVSAAHPQRSSSPGGSSAPAEGRLPAWHAEDLEALYRLLDCDLTGLSEADAARRLRRYGENRLPEAPPTPGWRIFLRQFTSPLIYILLIAAAVSVLLGLPDDALFILGVLVLNAVIGYTQEAKAERDIHSLARLLVSRARVERAGFTREVPSTELVPGDVVWLESGAHVTADLRLVEAYGLRVDQSLLTGESLPVEKGPGEGLAADLPPSDQSNMLFSGSTVFQGRARALVVGTGLNSQVGLIARSLQRAAGVKPPLLIRMERFTRVIAGLVGGLCVLIFLAGWLRGTSAAEMLMSALALSVSAIPEGLPVALTVALAIGVKRMARRNVLVRRLEAVEGLGSCSVIGSDKTGTLTTNQLTVVAGVCGGAPFAVSGSGFVPEGQVRRGPQVLRVAEQPLLERLVRVGALCNEASLVRENHAWEWAGDPTDVALLALAIKAGAEPGVLNGRYPPSNVIPFEPERRFAASFRRTADGGGLTVVKGAPERVLGMCDAVWLAAAATPQPLPAQDADAWVRALARDGNRVLALAERETLEPVLPGATPPEPGGLTLVGLVGMTDPPREGVPEAIAACRHAGIRVVMITGDHLDTAWSIAARISLAPHPTGAEPTAEAPAARTAAAAASVEAEGTAMDGAVLEALPAAELDALAGQLTVVGRATPLAKLAIVQAMQRGGDFVAVTGDGVNDAPALREANIGVAMGKAGTDVAREAADLVITDDDFASIVAGVEEGRVAYENVRKVIYLLVSTGLGEVLAVMLAMLAALPVPFLPAQLLWLNLVTNGIQDVALAFEPREGGIMQRPPRPPREAIFNRIMVERTLLACLVFGGVSFAWYAWLLHTGTALEDARGLMLNLFVVFEMFHAGNSRSETRSLLTMNPLSNRLLFLGTLMAMAVHLAALQIPFMQGVLRSRMPGATEWGWLVGLGAAILVASEVQKAWHRRRARRNAPPAAPPGATPVAPP